MPANVYEIYADQRKIGIVVAFNEMKALERAYHATTRRTDSKNNESCDYKGVVVRKLTGYPARIGDWLPKAAST